MSLRNVSQQVYSQYIVHQKQAIMWLNDLTVGQCKENSLFDNYRPYIGMSVGEPSPTTRDAVYIDVPNYDGGIHDNLEEQIIGENPIRWDIPLEYPRGRFINNGLDKFVRPGSRCRADVVVFPDCVDECEFWAFIFPNSNFRHINMDAIVVPSDSGNGVQANTQITTKQIRMQLGLTTELLYQSDQRQFTTLINCNPENGCGCEENCRCFYLGFRSTDDSIVGFDWTTDAFETILTIDLTAELGPATGPDAPQRSVPFQGLCSGDRVYFTTVPQTALNQNMPTASGGRVWRMGEDGSGITELPTPDGIQAGVTHIYQDKFGGWWAFGGGAAGSGLPKPSVYSGTSLEQLGPNSNDTDFTGTDDAMILNDVAYDSDTNTYYLAVAIGTPVGEGKVFSVKGGEVNDITLQITQATANLPAGQAPTALAVAGRDTLVVGLRNGDLYEARCVSLDNAFYYVGNYSGQILDVVAEDVRQVIFVENRPPLKRDFFSRGEYQEMNVPNIRTTPTAIGSLWIQKHGAVKCENNTRLFPGFNDLYFASEGGQVYHMRPCNDNEC